MYFKDEMPWKIRTDCPKFQWISAAFAEGGNHPSIQQLFPVNSTFILPLFHIFKSSSVPCSAAVCPQLYNYKYNIMINC